MANGGGGNAGNDLLFVILVLVVLSIVWLATGGIERAKNEPGFFLKPPAPLGSDAVYGPSFSDGVEGTARAVENSFSETERELERVSNETGRAVEFGSLSPYHGMVHFRGGVSYPGASNPADEYIEISYDGGGEARIDITRWRLVSSISNSSVVIPQGTRIPQSGAVSFQEDILLSPGDSAYIISGRSPIGTSFLPNKCTSYFEQYQSFYPRFNQYCPSSVDEMAYAQDQTIRNSNACYDYVSSLSSCKVHTGIYPQPLPSGCQYFIENDLTYTGCVRNHKSDADFLARDWRVYLARDSSLWRDRREVLKLVDAQGLTVDVLTY